MSYLNSKAIIAAYSEIDSINSDFPTFRDYCLYVCGGDYAAFDDYNTLANHMMNDDLKKGVSIC